MPTENEKLDRKKKALEEQQAAALAGAARIRKPMIEQPNSQSDALEIKESLPSESSPSEEKVSSTANPVADQITIQTTEPKAEQSERAIQVAPIHPSSIKEIKDSFEETKNELINAKDENGDPKHLKENGQPYTEQDFSYRQSKDENGRTIHVFSTPSEKTRDHFIQALEKQGIAQRVTPNARMGQADQKESETAKKFKEALGGSKAKNPQSPTGQAHNNDPKRTGSMANFRKGLTAAATTQDESKQQEQSRHTSTAPKPMSTTPAPR